MSRNSLPSGLDHLKEKKMYVNISKLPEGEYKFRIVQPAIAGWVEWDNNKPYRYLPDKKPKFSKNPEDPLKTFWALYVWDYAQEGLYIMEVLQKGVLNSLESLGNNDDWGDITTFDFKIKKEKTNKVTPKGHPVFSYSVIPIPHKPMNNDIKEAVMHTKVRLEALYEGKDPWNDLEESEVQDPDVLSAAQISLLGTLTSQITDQKYLYNLEEYLECVSLDCMHPKHFDRAVRSLEKKIREINNESNVA